MFAETFQSGPNPTIGAKFCKLLAPPRMMMFMVAEMASAYDACQVIIHGNEPLAVLRTWRKAIVGLRSAKAHPLAERGSTYSVK
jgi:hypothetical protein